MPQPNQPPIIVLKLDDIAQHQGAPIHPNWQKTADFLESQKIPSAMGIIGDTLESDNPAYFQWIKSQAQKGFIEFWHHGYHCRTHTEPHGEFELGTAADQKIILQRTLQLAKQKLNLPLPAFGPHWSATTDATDLALSQTPEIKIWLCGPAHPKFFKGLSLPWVIALEDPIFEPDIEKFKRAYHERGTREKVLALQGHSAAWEGKRWDNFTQIIAFLQSQNSTFMTPSQFLNFLTKSP